MISSRFNMRGHQPRNAAGRPAHRHDHRSLLRRLPLASAISAILAGGVPLAHAQTAPTAQSSDTLEEVTVTAQKVTENLQNVPISIEAIGTQKLQQLNIANLDEYVEYLAGVTTIKSIGQGGNGVGTSHVYMRGINSGQDGNHSGSQPTVGTYFDEQPVTTIDGTVDVHLYDIARVEVLEGPQGTLYGASSEAGTIRIISNKPDTSKFEAGYDVAGDAITNGGGQGWKAEGFVNIPLTDWAAVRLVGWDEHDPGYINNVAGTNANCGHRERQSFVPDLDRRDGPDLEQCRLGQQQLQHRRIQGRPGRLEVRFERQLDGDPDLHGAADRRHRFLRL